MVSGTGSNVFAQGPFILPDVCQLFTVPLQPFNSIKVELVPEQTLSLLAVNIPLLPATLTVKTADVSIPQTPLITIALNLAVWLSVSEIPALSVVLAIFVHTLKGKTDCCHSTTVPSYACNDNEAIPPDFIGLVPLIFPATALGVTNMESVGK